MVHFPLDSYEDYLQCVSLPFGKFLLLVKQAADKKEVQGLEKCALKQAKSGCSLFIKGASLA